MAALGRKTLLQGALSTVHMGMYKKLGPKKSAEQNSNQRMDIFGRPLPREFAGCYLGASEISDLLIQ